MSEEIIDGTLFVTGSLSDPYQGSRQHDPAYINEREANKAFWEAVCTGANLTDEQKQTIRSKLAQFKDAVDWFKQNDTTIPPSVVVRFLTEACGLIEHLGYVVDLDPGPMPS